MNFLKVLLVFHKYKIKVKPLWFLKYSTQILLFQPTSITFHIYSYAPTDSKPMLRNTFTHLSIKNKVYTFVAYSHKAAVTPFTNSSVQLTDSVLQATNYNFPAPIFFFTEASIFEAKLFHTPEIKSFSFNISKCNRTNALMWVTKPKPSFFANVQHLVDAMRLLAPEALNVKI